MRKENKMDYTIVRKLFMRILPVQMLIIIATSINNIVDTMIVGRYLGSDALAGVGLCSPISYIVSMTGVIVTGAQILCCAYIGRGEREKVIKLFSTSASVLFLLGIGFMAILLILAEPFAVLLGADGLLKPISASYLRGIAFGMAFQNLSSMLTGFAQLNNDSKRSYISLAFLVIINVALDLVMVRVINGGIFGIALASTASYIASAVILGFGFVGKGDERAVVFRFGKFVWKDLFEAIRLGIPVVLLFGSIIVKAYVMNIILVKNGGADPVAAFAVENTIASFVCSVPVGISNAILLIGAVYRAEENREMIKKLFHVAMRIGLVLSVVLNVALFVFRYQIAGLFCTSGEAAFDHSVRMLELFPTYLIPNTILFVCLKMFQAHERQVITNFFAFFENLSVAIFAFALFGVLKYDSVWLSLTFGEVFSLLLLCVIVWIRQKKITFKISEWYDFDKQYLVREDEMIDFTIRDMDDVCNTSEKIIRFCERLGADKTTAAHAGLCMEEMAANIVQHGFSGKDSDRIDIHVSYHDGNINLKLQDTCKFFDPKKFMDQFNPEDITQNIGIRLVGQIAKEMSYQNNLGMNALTIKL